MRIDKLDPMTSSRLRTIDEGAGVQAAALSLSDPRTGMAVVCDGTGAVTGILTKSDLVRHLACPAPGASSAGQLMSRAVVSCRRQDDLQAVWRTMIAHGLQNVPVVDSARRPVGVLDIRDAVTVLLEQEEFQEHMLVNYIAGVGYR